MTQSNTTTHAATVITSTESRRNTLLPALVALGFGAFLIFMTAFAKPEAVHSAAHDTRHSFAVPCH